MPYVGKMGLWPDYGVECQMWQVEIFSKLQTGRRKMIWLWFRNLINMPY
jgi:hypothetical protein